MPEARGLRRIAVVRETNVRQDQKLGGRTKTLERGHGPYDCPAANSSNEGSSVKEEQDEFKRQPST